MAFHSLLHANGARNPFYESMREVAPGDLIFSFVDTRIIAIGIAESYCYESPRPTAFGDAGMNWEAIGWRVRVRFTNLTNRIGRRIFRRPVRIVGKPYRVSVLSLGAT